jgi:hypothetical protein
VDPDYAAAQSMQIFLVFAGLVFTVFVCLFASGIMSESDRH